MADNNGNSTLTLKAGGADGSQFMLLDPIGLPTILMRSSDGINQGPDFQMYNSIYAKSVEIDGDVGGNGSGGIDIFDEDGTRTYMLRGAEVTGQGSALKMFDADGNLTIELDADFGGGGDGRVITDELQIQGGSDLAEYFSSLEGSGLLSPGTVVVIDPDHPGGIMTSQNAYDKKVVGIVSGANGIKPGMLMGQKESIAFGEVPVAIAGRVYVKTDPSGQEIAPGDFLTTSTVPGTAMRVKNWRKSRGAILGKALTAPDEDGFVLVLVHLQ